MRWVSEIIDLYQCVRFVKFSIHYILFCVRFGIKSKFILILYIKSVLYAKFVWIELFNVFANEHATLTGLNTLIIL